MGGDEPEEVEGGAGHGDFFRWGDLRAGASQDWGRTQTASLTTMALGMRPSLKKRSAVCCWPAMTASVSG